MDSTRDQENAVLLRAAILGDRDALGALCESLRPLVYSVAYDFLAGFRLESHTEDVTQDVFCDVCGSFLTYDPSRGTIKRWVRTITMYTCYDHASRNRVAIGKVPLLDPGDDVEDEEYRLDPLDSLSREAWEQDRPSKPISQSNRHRPTYITVARRKEIAAQAGKAAPPPKRRGGNGTKKTRWELARILKNRLAWAADASTTAGGSPG
jgi:DNA-directed RNA polymerase specialized sigma24 family protein